MFRKDQSGSVALMFALLLPALVAAIGGGIEVSRALEYKQRLTTAADLTCRQAEVWVESTLTANPTKSYKTDIQGYADKNKSEKKLTTATITAVGLPKPVAPTSISVTATGAVDLIFKSFLTKDAMSFSVTRTCAVAVTTDPGQQLWSESFEDNHSVATNSWTVLKNWNNWTTTNAGIEINGQSQLTGDSIKFGSFFAELDSDCGTSANSGVKNCQANSAMSRTQTLSAGTYVIKYWYVARKKNDNPYPNSSLICSNSAWNTDTYKPTKTGMDRDTDVSAYTADQQTRRIELYVEKRDTTKTDGGYLDFTKDFTKDRTLYTEMADVCIWADNWTERSYTFTVSQSAEYRISWRAAGLQDTYGGLIDYLRLCKTACN